MILTQSFKENGSTDPELQRERVRDVNISCGVKKYLLQDPVLKLPDLLKPFILKSDASRVGVVAVLMQANEVKIYSVSYASKKLSLSEVNSPITKECLAVVWDIRGFQLYQAGKRFTLQTNHKLLKYLKDAAE